MPFGNSHPTQICKESTFNAINFLSFPSLLFSTVQDAYCYFAIAWNELNTMTHRTRTQTSASSELSYSCFLRPPVLQKPFSNLPPKQHFTTFDPHQAPTTEPRCVVIRLCSQQTHGSYWGSHIQAKSSKNIQYEPAGFILAKIDQSRLLRVSEYKDHQRTNTRYTTKADKSTETVADLQWCILE